MADHPVPPSNPQTPAAPPDATPTPDPAPPAAAAPQEPATGPDSNAAQPPHGEPASEVDWKAEARKHEARAKANAAAARELATLKASQMSETEQAVAAAKAEAQRGYGQRLAAAEIRAALTGVITDEETRSGFLDSLDLARFVTDDGEVDTDAVAGLKQLAARLTPAPPPPTPPDTGQGTRGDSPVPRGQLTRADLAGKSPEWIDQQRRAGRLNDLLHIT